MRNNILDIIPHFLYNQIMKYCTTTEIADRWNISDRRVRVLCREGRIPGVIEENGSYLIPYDAIKPGDKRYRREAVYSYTDIERSMAREAEKAYRTVSPILYMKWGDDVVAQIDSEYSVYFTAPEYNTVVSELTQGRRIWDREQFESFLQDRIVSRDRRDIERILFRCGLSSYDVIKVAEATKAINASDMLWITRDPDERIHDAASEVFESVFLHKIDAQGESIDTPEGFNIKRYGVFRGQYGIYKKRISPVTCDVESELAVSGLAELMGVPCCRTYRIDEDTIFSRFEYDFSREYIVHMRRLYEANLRSGFIRSDNEYRNLLSIRPQYQVDFIRMIALDFVTRQDDRHLSNIAVKLSNDRETFYPLYDNGRSLFYEDTEETAARACRNDETFATAFGASGTYYDYVKEIAGSGTDFSALLNLDIRDAEIREVLKKSGFKGYRLDASEEWIGKTLQLLKELSAR